MLLHECNRTDTEGVWLGARTQLARPSHPINKCHLGQNGLLIGALLWISGGSGRDRHTPCRDRYTPRGAAEKRGKIDHPR